MQSDSRDFSVKRGCSRPSITRTLRTFTGLKTPTALPRWSSNWSRAPDLRSSDAGVDHLGNARYVVDTGRCFPYFAKHNYCSICLPVCVYNHKEWARDFEGAHTKLFPSVVMHEPPAAVDVAAGQRHVYPLLERSSQ